MDLFSSDSISSIASVMGQGLVLLEVKGSDFSTIICRDDIATRFFSNFQVGEVYPVSELFEIIDSQSLSSLKSFLLESLAKGPGRFECKLVYPDREKQWVRISVFPLKKEGSSSTLGLLIEDTSSNYLQMKKISTLENKVHNLESKLLAREVPSMIAHQLNSLLTINSLRVSAIESSLDKQEFPKSSEIKRLKENADLMVEIVKSLRSLFMPERIKEEAEKKNLTDIINRSIAIAKESFDYTGIEVKVTCPEQLPVLVRETEIIQVFLNLLKNSVEAIRLHDNPSIEVCGLIKDGQVQINFKDSGTVTPKVAECMFYKHFSSKPLTEGRGIGLMVSKKIVLEHRGEIFLDRKSLNTSIYLNLPSVSA